MMKGLMDCCVSQEMVVGRLRETLGAKEMELQELMAWKEIQVEKLDLAKKLLKESEAQAEALKKILKDKEGVIKDAKDKLCQAKEDAIMEYHDFDTLLKELSGSFADGFDDCFRQVKVSFSDLDLSHISIKAQPRTLAHPVYSEGIDELFVDNSTPEPQGGEETTLKDQAKPVEDEFRPLEGNQSVGEKDR